MMKITKYITIFCVVLIGQFSFAADMHPDTLIARGNQAYNEGLYDSAIQVYSKVLEEGLESYELYYNMGNAYFKNNQLPSAILYYEKAKKIAPNDEDVNFNLSIANSMIVDKIEQVPEMFYKRWWNYFYNAFSEDTWTFLSLVSWIIFLFFTGLFLITKSRGTKKLAFYLGLLFLLITIGTFGLSSQKYYYTKENKEAIIFTPTITAKSSPTQSSVDLFVIHEGTKVQIMDEVQGWVKIKIRNGSIGWLPGDSVKRI
jgi:tetratricopeptide (TPR) repeat protein